MLSLLTWSTTPLSWLTRSKIRKRIGIWKRLRKSIFPASINSTRSPQVAIINMNSMTTRLKWEKSLSFLTRRIKKGQISQQQCNRVTKILKVLSHLMTTTSRSLATRWRKEALGTKLSRRSLPRWWTIILRAIANLRSRPSQSHLTVFPNITKAWNSCHLAGANQKERLRSLSHRALLWLVQKRLRQLGPDHQIKRM